MVLREAVSLAQAVGDEQEDSLEAMLEDRTAPAPQDGVEESLRKEEIGRTFRLTRERARQIQVQAINKLKQSPGYERLRGYWA